MSQEYLCLSVCLSVCISLCLWPSISVCLSFYLPVFLSIICIHLSPRILWQSLYTPGIYFVSYFCHECLLSVSCLCCRWCPVTCFFFIHPSPENILLLNIAWCQINYDDSSVDYFSCHENQSSGHHIADLLFSLCRHLHYSSCTW